MSLILFIRLFSESTAYSRRSVGEGRGMPTPAVGSLLLLSNQNLGTISGSHSQIVLLRVRDQRRGHGFPWCCFSVKKLCFIQGLFLRESVFMDSYRRIRALYQTSWAKKSATLASFMESMASTYWGQFSHGSHTYGNSQDNVMIIYSSDHWHGENRNNES